MVFFRFRGSVAIGLIACALVAAEAQEPAASAPTESDANSKTGSDRDAAIRKNASEFVSAFNRGDAAAIADHFLPNGVFVEDAGRRLVGRDAIRKEYEAVFAENPERRLLLVIDSIHFVDATTAIEEGRLAVMPQPIDTKRVMSHYTAVHSYQDGRWRIAHVRDTRVELPLETGRLEQLEWLIGQWRGESEGVVVDVSFRWIHSQQYLERSHTVSESEEVTATATQFIGNDPQTGQLTSWSFTSDGGRAVEIWFRTEEGWLIQSNGLLGDGTPTVAKNVLSRKDDNTIIWRSVDRAVGGAPMPDLQNVTLSRL